MDVIIINIPEIDVDEVNLIVDKTVNTWQKNRTRESKFQDTKLWKIAEKVVENYINENKKDYSFISYDKLRTNNYSKHAPFDLLIYKKDLDISILNDFIKKINNEITNNEYWKISDTLKLDLEKNSIFIVEIKSTRIIDRHLVNWSDDNNIIEIIKNDDFLEYPKYLREDRYDNMNLQNYINFCNKYKGTNIKNEDELREIEKQNMRHIYFRVYISEKSNKAYIIWFIDKNYFSKNFIIKKMPQYWKSGKALYLAVWLKNAKSINQL